VCGDLGVCYARGGMKGRKEILFTDNHNPESYQEHSVYRLLRRPITYAGRYSGKEKLR
jgi:hypothetical protein